VPLVAAALCGGFDDLTGLNASLRYAVVLPGSLLSAWALQAYRRAVYPNATALTIAAVCMAFFAVVSGIIVPKASFYPAVLFNDRLLLDIAGIPVQFLRCLFMALIGAHIWALYGQIYCSLYPETKKHYSFHTITRFSVILVMIAGIGWLLTVRLGTITKEKILNAKLVTTQSIASGLNPAHIAALAWSVEDIQTPHFKTLKQQLEAAKQATPLCRFTYLVGLRGKDIVFLVDAEPPASKDYSPPGQIYDEATPLLFSVFADGKPAVEGPETDRWGTWVSSLAPIKNHASGKVLAVLGQDIDAGTWQTLVYRSRLIIIFITLLVALIVVGFFIVRQRDLETSARITASEERYRVLVEGSPNTVCLLDRDGCVVAVNQAGAALISESSGPEHLRGWRLADIVREADRGVVAEALVRAARGESVRFEAAISRPDGRTVILDGLLNPVRDSDTIVRHCIGLFIDVTQRKLAEQEREKLIAELQTALQKVKLLSGLVPICAACKKIRDDKGYWNQLEEYIEDHSQAMFSHGLCPECMKKLYPEFDPDKTG